MFHHLRLLVLAMLPGPLLAADEWHELFANDSFDQWVGSYDANKKINRPVGELWTIKDGVLQLDRSPQPEGERKKRGGFIVTKKKYWNFELKFEFKISHDGNSGIKYRTDDAGLGFEYQIIDDVHYRDNKKPNHRSCALYEIKAADEEKKDLGTAGKTWNSGRIVAQGNTIQHWVNDKLVMEIEYGSPDWKERFEKSKYFKQGHHHFGSTPGPILLQDHQDSVSFRNVLIRELEDEPESTEKAAKEEKKAAPSE